MSSDESRAWRVMRRLAAVPVLALIAIAPWFVPWPHSAPTVGSQPPVVIHRSVQKATDANVKEVTKAIAELAVGGYDVPVPAREVARVSTRPGPFQSLGRIQIPAIGLDVSYGEGVSAETLEKGPGHWPGTPMPGRDGNAVISGHRNTHTQPFKYLNKLRPGDTIITRAGQQAPVTYQVTKTTIVPQAQYKDFVLRQPADDHARQITLFACHPEGNPIYRIVVQAQAQPAGS